MVNAYVEDYSRNAISYNYIPSGTRGRRGRYRMVVGFITTYAISTYHH